MATLSSFASMVPEPSVSKRSKASLHDKHWCQLGLVADMVGLDSCKRLAGLQSQAERFMIVQPGCT